MTAYFSIDEAIEDGHIKPPENTRFLIKLMGERWCVYERVRSGWLFINGSAKKETALEYMQDAVNTRFFDSNGNQL